MSSTKNAKKPFVAICVGFGEKIASLTGLYSVLQNFAAKHPVGTGPMKQWCFDVNVDTTLFSYFEGSSVNTKLLLAVHF